MRGEFPETLCIERGVVLSCSLQVCRVDGSMDFFLLVLSPKSHQPLFHIITGIYSYSIGQSPPTQGLLTGYPKNESNAGRNRDDAALRISDGALFHLPAGK